VFIGRDDRSLDDKGRLVLPTKYRRPYEDAGGGVLTVWDRCLALWTPEEYDVVVKDIRDKGRQGLADENFVRLFPTRASSVQLDSQGRFHIAEEHRAHAGIVRDVKVLGQTEHVEIWDRGRFEQLEGGQTPDDVSAEIRRLHLF
jgi:MraZ protein